ncbi:NTP transferase domain-containing protein [Deinococcus sp. Marseille-Q6407]|uniref:nucleotidyltransferase family protein n=1 Tax=Deinococcus sp. Marseille-Q6407 TaxID=2969223 RepID=UPI0021C01334|nr:NTP transferase domain-containing protein [Deinococcus sp. Marseille-Q6407]
MRLAGILLAAGKGERMRQASGSLFSGEPAGAPKALPPKVLVPKVLVPLTGQPLCRHAGAALAGADDALRLAVVPPGELGAEVAAALDGLGFECVINPQPGRGLLSSFQAAVQALPAEIGGAVFALADMPLVSLDTHRQLREVAANATPEQVAAVQCVYGEVAAPPLLLRRALFPELLALDPTDHGPRQLLRQYRAQTAELQRPAAELLDVDTPEALSQARKIVPR